uniref:Secreted protein n=1 Tax=Eutreptiella gymnastica TaxID=73025 RepID=A0A7S4FRJ0_9EUGL
MNMPHLACSARAIRGCSAWSAQVMCLWPCGLSFLASETKKVLLYGAVGFEPSMQFVPPKPRVAPWTSPSAAHVQPGLVPILPRNLFHFTVGHFSDSHGACSAV